METDCADVADKLLEIMCFMCPRYDTNCMPVEDECNHAQMLVCLDSLQDRLNEKYPAEDELEHPYEPELSFQEKVERGLIVIHIPKKER